MQSLYTASYESYNMIHKNESDTHVSRMNRSRSQFINFIEICNAALCLFQITTSIIQEFLTNRFNIFTNITSLRQWCTINLCEWNVQEIGQSLENMFYKSVQSSFVERTFIIWVFPEPVGPKTRIFDFSKSKSSTSSSTSFDALSENSFRYHAWSQIHIFHEEISLDSIRASPSLTRWLFITPISTRW